MGFLDENGVTRLCGDLQSRFAPNIHQHAATSITSGKLAIGRIPTGTTSSTVALGNHTHSDYQPTLVSGTNIKTINSQSLLGSGNLAISGGSSSWTNVSNVNAPGGATSIDAQTDGHFVYVSALEAYPTEDGVLVEGLPESIYGAFFSIWLVGESEEYRLFTFVLDGNALMVANMETYDPSVYTLYCATFSIIYPISSS